MSLRVLVVGSVLGQPAGGVRRHNAELLPRLARALEAEGGALSVLVGTGGLGFELPDTVELHATSVPPRPPLVRATLEGRWLRRLLDQAARAGRPYDLVHTAHHPVPRHLPVPHSLMVHDLRALSLEHSPFSRRLFARQILGRGVEGAAVVEAVSGSTRAELLRSFRLPPERVHVVRNGIDHLEVLPRESRPDAPLLVLGHLEPRKNAEVVLGALAHDASLPRARFVGAAKGDARARIEAHAARLGVSERVDLEGPAPERDLPRLYASAACVVCPAHLEGFGLVPAEALRAGSPVAVSRIPAHLEVCGPDVPSFDPRDPIDCARAIGEALAQPAVAPPELRWDDAAAALLAAWRAAARPA